MKPVASQPDGSGVYAVPGGKRRAWERPKVSAASGGTIWLHGPAGRVLREEGETYARDYVWADGALIGYEEDRDADGDGERERFKRYILADHLGSAIAVLDETGNLLGTTDYSAFGESGGGSEDLAPIYTGKQWDADAGLYYFNARWYDPELGRFTTEDPIKDGGNWYAYVGNRPLVFTDPMGLRPIQDVGEGIVWHEDTDTYSRGNGAEAKIEKEVIPAVLAAENVKRNYPGASKEDQRYQAEVYLDKYYKDSFVSRQKTAVGDYQPRFSDMAELTGMLLFSALPWESIAGISFDIGNSAICSWEVFVAVPATSESMDIFKGSVIGLVNAAFGSQYTCDSYTSAFFSIISNIIATIEIPK